VFGPTGVALTGIGNGTVKWGTLANKGSASPGAARSRTPGKANIPPAPTAPLTSNSRLEMRLLVIFLFSLGLAGPKRKTDHHSER
jgi:hypothetical protein